MSKSQAPTGTEESSIETVEDDNPQPDVSIDSISDTSDVFENINNFIDDILSKADDETVKETVIDFIESASGTALTRYSFRNQMIIYLQLQDRGVDYKDNARHFAGYNTWQSEHNRHVESGESGYSIVAPRTGLICPECGNTPNYHRNNDWLDCDRAGTAPESWDIDPQEEWSEGIYGFRKATTFAYQQTKPLDDVDEEDVFKPMDEQTELNTDEATEETAQQIINTIKTLVERNAFEGLEDDTDIEIREAKNVAETLANGVSKGGEIHITPQEATVKELKTLVHEIAHEINHHKDGQQLPSEVKEVEAETIAYAVCRHFGVGVSGSDLYLASWAQHARKNGQSAVDNEDADDSPSPRDIIKDRLTNVQETTAEIIETIESKLATQPEQENKQPATA